MRSFTLTLVVPLLISHLDCLTTAAFLPGMILARETSDCPSSYARCADAKLPSNFCCPTSATCISLDSSSSAICCPQGSDCTFIEPLTCDIQAQNATANPSAFLKTTKLTGTLPTCGDLCCPFGYTCGGNDTCALIKATSSEATTSVASRQSTTTISNSNLAASTSSPTSGTSSSVSSVTSPAAPSATHASSFPSSVFASLPSTTTLATSPPVLGSSTNSQSNNSQFPAKAIVAGFFPGLIAGVLAALSVMICIRRRQRKPDSQMLSSLHPRSSNGTIIGISDPIPSDTQSMFRTDFLLRKSDNQYVETTRSKSMLRRTGSRVRTWFGGSPKPMQQPEASSPPPPLPSMPFHPRVGEKGAPSTPPPKRQVRRQSSTESIHIYSPASVLANTGIMQRPPLNKSTPNLHAVMNGNLQSGLNIHARPPLPHPPMPPPPPVDGNSNNVPSLRPVNLSESINIQTVPSHRPNTTFNDILEKVGFPTDNGDPYYRVTKTPTPHPGQGQGQTPRRGV